MAKKPLTQKERDKRFRDKQAALKLVKRCFWISKKADKKINNQAEKDNTSKDKALNKLLTE